MYVNPKYDKGIERKLYFTGSYEKGLLRILDKLVKPGNIVVDAGANIGLISIFCALRAGQNGLVLSFEPHPETYPILKKNIAVNGISQIDAYNKALGSTSGTAKIYSNLQINRGAASMVEFQEDSPSFDVEVVSLDSVLKQHLISNLDLLKIDVEGFEMEVLKGAKGILSGNNGPFLVIECSNTRSNFNYSLEELFDFLNRNYCYHIYKLSNSKEKISRLVSVQSWKDLPEHDNILAFKNDHLLLLKKYGLI
ncbi:FkbM family methyltransferase [Aquiflexum sp. XJ19-10]|nr:FkbM family methyltransferase [Aquiflexum gelatinilyticum]MCS4434556.1 FkbM family methyltransferase [Aquiflexum gelatinilyticum]